MAPRRFSDEPAPPSLAPIQPPQPGMFDHAEDEPVAFRYPAETGHGYRGYEQPAAEPEYAPPPLSGGWQPRSWHSFLIRIAIAIIVMTGSAGGLYLTYAKGQHDAIGGEVPLVKADPTAMKVKPANPGGMVNDTEDAVAYQPNITGNGQVENLLAAPEDPLAKPQVAPDAIAAPVPPPRQPLPPPVPEGDSASASDAAAPGNAAPDAASADASPPAAVTPAPAPPPAPVVVAPAPAKPPQARVAAVPKNQNPAQELSSGLAPAIAALTAPQTAELPGRTPPVAPLAGGTYRIQLASTRDVATAHSEWQRIQHAHADLLSGLAPAFVKADLGEKGVYYRIQAGPMRDKAAAQKLCTSLRAADVGCLVVRQ